MAQFSVDGIVDQIRAAGGDQLAAARAAHHDIEARLTRAALDAAGWSLTGAATLLGCPKGTMQKALGRHPEIEAERLRRGPVPLTQRKKRGGA